MPGPVQIVLCVMPPQNAFKQQKSPASQVSLKAGVPNLIISQWVYSSQVPKSLGLVFEEHEAPADPSMLPPLLFPEKKWKNVHNYWSSWYLFTTTSFFKTLESEQKNSFKFNFLTFEERHCLSCCKFSIKSCSEIFSWNTKKLLIVSITNTASPSWWSSSTACTRRPFVWCLPTITAWEEFSTFIHAVVSSAAFSLLGWISGGDSARSTLGNSCNSIIFFSINRPNLKTIQWDPQYQGDSRLRFKIIQPFLTKGRYWVHKSLTHVFHVWQLGCLCWFTINK